MRAVPARRTPSDGNMRKSCCRIGSSEWRSSERTATFEKARIPAFRARCTGRQSRARAAVHRSQFRSTWLVLQVGQRTGVGQVRMSYYPRHVVDAPGRDRASVHAKSSARVAPVVRGIPGSRYQARSQRRTEDLRQISYYRLFEGSNTEKFMEYTDRHAQDLTTMQGYMHLSPAALDAAIRLLDAPARGRGEIVEAAGVEPEKWRFPN